MSLDPQFQRRFFNTSEHLIEERFVLKPTQAQKWEYEQLLAPLKNLSPSRTQILEVGSGSGRLTFELLRRGYSVTAYDISEKPLKKLLQSYQAAKQSGWGKLTITTQLKKTPFADVLIGADILHHVKIGTTLPKWKTQLKPGGIALFSEPNAFYILWYLHWRLQGIPWKVEAGVMQCTPEKLKRAFLKSFLKFRIEGHALFPPMLLKQPLNLARYNALKFAKRTPLFAFRLMLFAQN